MKQLICRLFLALTFFSCESKKGSVGTDKKSLKRISKWDSLLHEADTVTGKTKEMINISPDHFDTTGIATSPIQILSKDFITEKNYLGLDEQFILIKYKNISQKTISGVKLRWFWEDGFGKPKLMVDVTASVTVSIGEDRNGERLKPGDSGAIKYKEYLETGYRIVSAWAYQVGFDDQSIWNIH